MKIIMIMGMSLCLVPLFSSAQQQYKIVYNVLEDREKDNYEIYSMNMDGTEKKNITNTPGVEWVYYAYKDKVYYISDIDTCHRCYFLYEMDAEGNNKKKISNLELEDSWMSRYDIATGDYLLVMGRIGKTVRNQLFQVNINNGTYKQLTDDTISQKRDPLFIPVWNQVVMAYRPDKSLRKTVPDELWKFCFDYKACGSEPLKNWKVQLTYFPKEDTSTKWFEYHAGPPQWNSKKKFISYLSRQKGQTQVYAVTPNGKKQWQITSSGNLSNGWHSWSSDGKWVAMDKSTHEGKNFDIYLMNYKTKKEIRLTDSDKTEQAPVIVEVKK